MAQWNPPPPDLPTITEDSMLPLTDDAIGDTVFSKAWVLSLLVRAVKVVQYGEKASGGPGMAVRDAEREERKPEGATVVGNDSEAKGRSHTCEASEEPVAIDDMEQQRERETEDEGFGEVERSGATGEDDSQEINESLENDLCRLWDASMNPDMTLFLHEQLAIGLLLGVATKTAAPRLTEICIGILGNMACMEKVCVEGLCDQAVIQQLLSFLWSSDSRILFETTRLAHTCVSHEAVQPVWLAEIRQSPHLLQDLTFILQSSTNEELLRNMAMLLDRVLDCDSRLLEEWSSRELVEAICEAIQQTRLSSFDATCTFVMTLQLLSTLESGVPFLVECEEQVCALLCDFLLSFEHSEDSLSSHQPFVMAALSLLAMLIENSPSEHVKESLKSKDVQQLLHSLLEYSPPNCRTSNLATESKDTANKCTSGPADSESDPSKTPPSGAVASSADTAEVNGGGMKMTTPPHSQDYMHDTQDSSNSLHLLVHKLLKYSNPSPGYILL